MAVSALVITTDSNFTETQRQELLQDERVTLGEAQGFFIPVVTETASIRDGQELAERLLGVVGVTNAQLVSWAESPVDTGECHGA